MTDDAGDFGVNKFLRNDRTAVRFFLVVLGKQFKLYYLAVDAEVACVGFINGEARAVFVILAQMGDATGQWCSVTDFDDGFFRRCCFGGGGGVNILRCGALRLELRLFVMLSAQVTFRGEGSVWFS